MKYIKKHCNKILMKHFVNKRYGLEIKSMERKVIFIGNLFLLFNNFIKIMCCAICRYKINLSNNIFLTSLIV